MLATFALLLATSTISTIENINKDVKGQSIISIVRISALQDIVFCIWTKKRHKIDVTLGHFALVLVRLIHLQESVLSNSLIQITGSK